MKALDSLKYQGDFNTRLGSLTLAAIDTYLAGRDLAGSFKEGTRAINRAYPANSNPIENLEQSNAKYADLESSLKNMKETMDGKRYMSLLSMCHLTP